MAVLLSVPYLDSERAVVAVVAVVAVLELCDLADRSGLPLPVAAVRAMG